MFQTKPAAIPIIMYKVVHTGAKTQFGGLNKGLFIVGNHVPTDVCVATDAKKPAAKQISMATLICINLRFTRKRGFGYKNSIF